MELNKRKSLLTPASPTAWGMIHGDISNQQDLIDKINSAVEGVEVDVDLTGYATESWVKEQGYLTEHQSLADYYTKDEVDTAIENVEVDVDLTGYATEDWVKKQNYLTEHQSLANYYTKSEVDEAISNIEVDTSDLATKKEVQDLKNNEVQTALMKSDAAQNTANSAEQKITELRIYVDEQIGGIDTMTDDILA